MKSTTTGPRQSGMAFWQRLLSLFALVAVALFLASCQARNEGAEQAETQPATETPRDNREQQAQGAQGDQSPQEKERRESAARIAEIKQDPGKFSGQTVTISGEVSEVWGDRSFRLGGDEFYGNKILVASKEPIQKVKEREDQPLRRDDIVQVTGNVKSYNSVKEAEQELGIDLAKGFESEWKKEEPVLVAENVIVVPRQAATGGREQMAIRTDFQKWDEDDNRMLTWNEFNKGFDGAEWFTRADTQKDDSLDKDEFGEQMGRLGAFRELDRNNDRKLSEEEIKAIVNPVYLSEWNKDNDGYLSEDEFYQGLYMTWDDNNDGKLSKDEYAEGWFELWDRDNDRTLAQNEVEGRSGRSESEQPDRTE